MAKASFESVDHYIAAQPEASRDVLEQLRLAMRKALPAAREIISYNMPAYKLDGGVVIYFAGWKKHYSLYPVTDAIRKEFAAELVNYEVNDKGTLRFSLAEKVPTGLVSRIAKFRATEVRRKRS